MVRRILSRRDGSRAGSVVFTEVSLAPCGTLGFGTVGSAMRCRSSACRASPGAALIGFEVLARPVIQVLSGAEPVFRPSVRGHLLETVVSPAGLREFRPAVVAERRGGGYTVQPLPGGASTLAGLAEANALLVLGERVTSAAAGIHGGRSSARQTSMSVVGYPAVLAEGEVVLRPYERRDAEQWSESPHAQRAVAAAVGGDTRAGLGRKQLRARLPPGAPLLQGGRTGGESMPFAICYQGQAGRAHRLGNIVRRAFSSAYCGYWVDSRVAGRGIMPTALALLVDHAFNVAGCTASRSTSGRRTRPRAGSWKSSDSAKRATTPITCTSMVPGAITSGMR